MFFIYTDTNFLNKSDSRVAYAMNAHRKEEGVGGVYGDYNGLISGLSVYMAIVAGRPWQPIALEVKEARRVYDTYPEFFYLCAAITQNDSSVFDLLKMDNFTKGSTGPFTGWKLSIPVEMVEKMMEYCQKNNISVPKVVLMTNWDSLWAEDSKLGTKSLMVTPIYLDSTDGKIYNCMNHEGQRIK